MSGLEANLADRESQLNSVTQERDGLRDNANKLTQQVASLEANLKAKEEQLAELNAFEERSLNAFKVLSSKIVTDQGELLRSQTVDSVNNLIRPLSEGIDKFNTARARAEGSLSGEITRLTSETGKLASALTKAPHVRGRWGEMLVERALELSGLAKGTYYTVQDADGAGGRTDFIVRLSNDREIIIDSKVSLVAYYNAQDATNEEERTQFLENHAKAVRNQVTVLAGKEYQQNLPNTADFVVMAMPDFALPAAVQHDHDLIDYALERRIVLVTFSMLVPLLKCIAMGWQQRKVGDEAQQIADCGRELYKRLGPFASTHLRGMGHSLSKAVEAYNASVGSFDRMVMPQARRFVELGIEPAEELEGPEVINHSVRSLNDRSLDDLQATKDAHAPQPSNAAGRKRGNGGKPALTLVFNGKRYPVDYWKMCLVRLCEVLASIHKDRFADVLTVPSLAAPFGRRLYFSRSESELQEPLPIGDTGIYVHTFVDSHQVKRLVGLLASHFGHDPPVIEESRPL